MMTWGSFVSKSLSLIIVLPLILTRLQTPEISLWYLFSMMISLPMIFDFGFTPTFSRVIAYAMGGASYLELSDYRVPGKKKTDRPCNIDTLERIYSTMHHLFFRFSLFIVLFMLVIGTWGLMDPIAKVSHMMSAWIGWAIIIISSYIIFIGNKYSAFLQGTDNIALLRRNEMFFSLVSISCAAMALLAGCGLLGLVISFQVWRVLNVLFNYYLCLKLNILDTDSIRCPGKTIDPYILKSVWPSAWRSGTGVFMSRILIDGSGFVYAQLGTSGAIASYLIGLRLIRMISQFSTAPFYSKLPNLAFLRARGEVKKQIKVAKRGMAFSYWTYAIGFVVFSIAGPFLFSIIGSHADFPDKLLWSLLGLAMFAERYGAMHIQLYSTTNHIIWHKANGISGLIFLILSTGLYNLIHVYAFPVALIISYLLFYDLYSARHSYNTFKLSFIEFERGSVFMPLIIIVTCSVLRFLF